MYVLAILIFSLSIIFRLDSGTVQTGGIFLFFS